MLLPTFDLGNKNYILGNSVVMILNPNSKPARRIILEAKSQNKYIDLTKGKAGKCLVLLDNDEVAMSFISVKTIKKRYMEYVTKVNTKKGEIILEPFLDIGFENFILPYKVTSIINSNTIPVKKIIKNAKLSKTLIDCTQGRKTRSALTLINGLVIISQIDSKTIKSNYMKYLNGFYELDDEENIEDIEENNEENEENEKNKELNQDINNIENFEIIGE